MAELAYVGDLAGIERAIAAGEDDRPVDLNVTNPDARATTQLRLTALPAAAIANRSMIVIQLLKLGPAMDRPAETDGSTALMFAAERGYGGIVGLLLDAGSDPNRRDYQGSTALARAARHGQPETIQRLLSRGADPCIANYSKLSPLHFAVLDPNTRFTNVKGHPVVVPAESLPRLQAVRMLAARKECRDAQDDTGSTPLHIAARLGSAKLVRILLESGASDRVKDGAGGTPSEAATRVGRLDISSQFRRFGRQSSVPPKGNR